MVPLVFVATFELAVDSITTLVFGEDCLNRYEMVIVPTLTLANSMMTVWEKA